MGSKGEEQRTFRVSRIRTAEILSERSTRPAAFDLAAYWEASTNRFREHLPRYDATFIVTHALLPWVCYRRSRVLDQVAVGDRVRVSLRFDVLEEARQFALAGGAELEVVTPLELREYVIATANAVASAYAGSTSAPGAARTLSSPAAVPATSMQGTVPRDP